jgi:hypothetical protein
LCQYIAAFAPSAVKLGLTMTSSSPVAFDSSIATLTISAVVKRFAADLAAQSWCIDVSAFPLKALHAESNYNASIDKFRYDFPSWAVRNNVRVEVADYAAFLRNLTDKLISLLPRVLGSSFKPIPERFFEDRHVLFANTFVPFAPDIPDRFEMPEILEEYLCRIFMNAQDRKYITEWIADIIQNASRRPMWAVVLTGAQGSGKSSIFRLISAALGYRHTWEHNQYAPAFEKFSEVLPDHLLVSFDDAVSSRDTYQKLKQAITRTSMSVQLKGVQKQVMRDVYSRILICSNSPRPLTVEEGDRRLYVAEPCQHKESPEETAAFFVRFNDWLEKPSTSTVIYHWLKTIDLSDFVPGSTVKTDTHALMVGLSASVLETLLAEYVEDAPIFHNENLLHHLAENGCRNPNADLIKMKMASLNYEQKRRKVVGCGDGQIKVWQRICTRGRPLTAEEAERIKSVVCPNF